MLHIGLHVTHVLLYVSLLHKKNILGTISHSFQQLCPPGQIPRNWLPTRAAGLKPPTCTHCPDSTVSIASVMGSTEQRPPGLSYLRHLGLQDQCFRAHPRDIYVDLEVQEKDMLTVKDHRHHHQHYIMTKGAQRPSTLASSSALCKGASSVLLSPPEGRKPKVHST